MTLKNFKGGYKGQCNRTACYNEKGVVWYHNDTKKYYCKRCADVLNNDPYNKADALRIYGGALLVKRDLTDGINSSKSL